MFHLRAFNNWLKSVLITESADQLKIRLKQDLDLKSAEQLLMVLDIGCGKGGDIEKWASAGVRAVIGVDFSSESLVSYRERLSRKARKPFRVMLVSRDCGVPPG
jgi:mRNA (guanine-N7-)-methyltransferase